MYYSENVVETRGKMSSSYPDQLFASIPVAQVVIDGATLNILHSNAKFSESMLYNEMELATGDCSFAALMGEEQRQRLCLQVQEATTDPTSGDKYSIYGLKSKDGRYKSHFVYIYPVANDVQGNKLWYHVMMMPNDAQYMGYVSFDTRELLSGQFTSEDFGTFEWLIEEDVALCSEGIYDIYELDKSIKNLSRKFIGQYLHPDDRQRVVAIVDGALMTGLPAEFETRIISENKNEKIIHSLIKCMLNSNGQAVRLLGSMRDITKRRTIENDIQKKMDDLNRSNKELEEFAYVASHDMQEPLRKISTFTDRLNDKYADVLTGDGAMYLDRVMASAENMRQLINNLLEFSRVSKSTQPFTQVNIGFVLHQVKADLELTIEETGTTIDSRGLPIIEGRMSQLKQLFDNIINNAIKFRKADVAPVINIRGSDLSREEQRKYGLQLDVPYYKIIIQDNGIGFEAEYATRIFQVFQRLHGKSEYPGSGIGLAICKKIAENHNGIIFAESVEGQGAKFIFILPEKQA